jgi:predicted Zn-dependent protease
MKHKLELRALLVIGLLALASRSAAADSRSLDVAALLVERQPSTMLVELKDEMREKVDVRWSDLLMADSQLAASFNTQNLYPHPALQGYVNLLGQSLLPAAMADEAPLSFKIIEDPMPYADSLATGSVFVSTGMISLLDNEAQLAFILMHEAGHVVLSHHLKQIIEEEKAEKKARRNRMIGAVAGAVVGGLVGEDVTPQLALSGLIGGAAVASAAGATFGRFRERRFDRSIQLESDEFATEMLLRQQYDAREAPILMAKMRQVVGKSNPVVGLAFAYAADLPERASRIEERLTGDLKPRVESVLGGSGFKMTSPRFHQLMSELKRDNGYLALLQDLFIIARQNLEEAAAIRTDDPVTMYYLGLLYRAIARTPEERSKAASYFKSAIRFDERRHRFPEAHLQHAVELISLEDPQHHAAIQQELKTYVILYQRREGGRVPPEMTFVYDYLELAGDREWVTYRVSNVSSSAPYQLTGDPEIDRP